MGGGRMGEVARTGQPRPAREADDSFSPADLGAEPPARSWLVEDCFMVGTVALLSSDGGLGKSLLMQQLCTAAALGKPWLGRQVQQCAAYALFCEDDREELWRRQADINRHYGCESRALWRLTYRSRPGRNNLLAVYDRWNGQAQSTALYGEICDHVVPSLPGTGARLVILDTASDVFGGNEIARDQVRSFISMLRRLAIAIQGVVVLTAHVSNEGLASGSGLAGNRAWSNSVRSRLYLTGGRAEKGREAHPNERLLRGMKNNYGERARITTLRWTRGVFEVVETATRLPYRDDEDIPF